MTARANWISEVWRWIDSDRPAVLEPDSSTTWRELFDLAARAATLLDRSGVRRGPSVPALVESNAGAFALTLAGALTGRPLAPLGVRLRADELAPIVTGLGGATVMLTEPAFTELAADVAERTNVTVQIIDLPASAPSPLTCTATPDDVAFVLHTSGTTGNPKRVPYTNEKMALRAHLWAGGCDLGPESKLLCASPFHHVAGLGNFAVAMSVGAACVPLKRFTVDAFNEARRHGPTHTLLVPTMIEMLLAGDALPVPTIRYLQYGAAPMRPETLRRLIELMPDTSIANLYGQTEGAPITCLTPDDHRRAGQDDDHLLASVGRPVAGLELAIHEPDNDGIGEVWVRAPHLAVTGNDGWLHTGDVGRCDTEGYLFLVARKNDMIVRGGENVYPTEIETLLDAQPGVHESAVVGVPDDRLGERVVAYLVLDDGASAPDPEALRTALSASLASFKVPSEYRVIAELPRNAAGKVLRRVLAQPTAP